MPLYCVVDCDPHGIDIMRTYKHGSKALGHEANTRIPGLRWLGVKMDDLFSAATARQGPSQGHSQNSQGINSQTSQSSANIPSQDSHASQASSAISIGSRRTRLDSLIQLTQRDRKTAQRILESIAGGNEDAQPTPEDREQMRELQVMLMYDKKLEIQAIDDMDGDLSDWLDKKMGA